MTERLYAKINGYVQGVGFRQFVKISADSLRLTGWVRNTWKDEVEVTIEGERDALEKMLALLRRGPRSAFVSDVQYEWLTATGEFTSFTVAATR
jgi:acylphosphatase